jgi:hypothetical protein
MLYIHFCSPLSVHSKVSFWFPETLSVHSKVSPETTFISRCTSSLRTLRTPLLVSEALSYYLCWSLRPEATSASTDKETDVAKLGLVSS